MVQTFECSNGSLAICYTPTSFTGAFGIIEAKEASWIRRLFLLFLKVERGLFSREEISKVLTNGGNTGKEVACELGWRNQARTDNSNNLNHDSMVSYALRLLNCISRVLKRLLGPFC